MRTLKSDTGGFNELNLIDEDPDTLEIEIRDVVSGEVMTMGLARDRGIPQLIQALGEYLYRGRPE